MEIISLKSIIKISCMGDCLVTISSPSYSALLHARYRIQALHVFIKVYTIHVQLKAQKNA